MKNLDLQKKLESLPKIHQGLFVEYCKNKNFAFRDENEALNHFHKWFYN